MQLFFKTLTGNIITLDVDNTATIYQVKQKLKELIDPDDHSIELLDPTLDRYQMVIAGKEPKNDQLLSDYDLRAVKYILLSFRKKPLQDIQQQYEIKDRKNINTYAYLIAQASRDSNNPFFKLPNEIHHKIIASIATHLPDDVAQTDSRSSFNFFNESHNKARRMIWLFAVQKLYKEIELSVKKLKYLDKNSAFTFTGSVLNAIRKGFYAQLSECPEGVGGIPNNIFEIIDTFIKKNPCLIATEPFFIGIESEIKVVESALNNYSLEIFSELDTNKEKEQQGKKLENLNNDKCIMM